MENNEKNNSIFPLVVIFIVIIALIGGAYWFGKSSIMKNSPKEEVSDVREATNSEENAVEEQESGKEEIVLEESGSAPEEGITEDVEEESNESVIETLKLLFAQKYERKVEDVNVTISERKGDYLKGGVKFAGELAGGYVLAAKVNDAWKIVFDGNGSWSCSAVDIVDFPTDMVPECWDEDTSQMVDRASR